MKMNSNMRFALSVSKGFTLIELLVVVAIIGILSSVVLASLNTARSKGKDATVKSQLSSMRGQAELFYSSNNTYAGVCAATVAASGFGGTGGPGLILATMNVTGTSAGNTNIDNVANPGAWNKITCHSDASGWMIEAPLSNSASGSPSMQCVDSTGKAKSSSASTVGGGTGLNYCP